MHAIQFSFFATGQNLMTTKLIQNKIGFAFVLFRRLLHTDFFATVQNLMATNLIEN